MERRVRPCVPANAVRCIPLSPVLADLVRLVSDLAFRLRDPFALAAAQVRPRAVLDSVTFRVGSKKAQ